MSLPSASSADIEQTIAYGQSKLLAPHFRRLFAGRIRGHFSILY